MAHMRVGPARFESMLTDKVGSRSPSVRLAMILVSVGWQRTHPFYGVQRACPAQRPVEGRAVDATPFAVLIASPDNDRVRLLIVFFLMLVWYLVITGDHMKRAVSLRRQCARQADWLFVGLVRVCRGWTCSLTLRTIGSCLAGRAQNNNKRGFGRCLRRQTILRLV